MNDRPRSQHNLWRGAVALAFCAPLLGCGAKSTNQPTEQVGASTRISAKPDSIALTAVDRALYDAEIARLRGKVVLVDFWATWCPPCVAQLPHTLELGRQYADRGLAVVTVSCDEPSDPDSVAKFLASKQAGGATNLISQFGGSPQTMEVFDIKTGAVPFYKLYDRTGKLRETFSIDPSAAMQYTAEDIEAAVKKLLAEEG